MIYKSPLLPILLLCGIAICAKLPRMLDVNMKPCVGPTNLCPEGWTCNTTQYNTKFCQPPTPTTPSPTTGPTDCVDSGSGCPDLAYLCDDPTYKPIMRVNCAKTCHICDTPANTCLDDPSAQCGTIFLQCLDPDYYDIMKKLCPVTCDMCSKPAPTPIPVNVCKDDARCTEWVSNGFCTKNYPIEQKKKFCPKSCKLC